MLLVAWALPCKTSQPLKFIQLPTLLSPFPSLLPMLPNSLPLFPPFLPLTHLLRSPSFQIRKVDWCPHHYPCLAFHSSANLNQANSLCMPLSACKHNGIYASYRPLHMTIQTAAAADRHSSRHACSSQVGNSLCMPLSACEHDWRLPCVGGPINEVKQKLLRWPSHCQQAPVTVVTSSHTSLLAKG